MALGSTPGGISCVCNFGANSRHRSGTNNTDHQQSYGSGRDPAMVYSFVSGRICAIPNELTVARRRAGDSVYEYMETTTRPARPGPPQVYAEDDKLIQTKLPSEVCDALRVIGPTAAQALRNIAMSDPKVARVLSKYAKLVGGSGNDG